MADKIFTDNDLLQEKSYDTRIAEAANVEADTDYLEQVPFKKRLTEAVESGSGGGFNATAREITIVNNFSSNVTPYGLLTYSKNNVLSTERATSATPGNTKTTPVLGSKLSSSGKCSAQWLTLRIQNASAITSITSEDVSGITYVVLPDATADYVITKIPSSVPNITITIA